MVFGAFFSKTSNIMKTISPFLFLQRFFMLAGVYIIGESLCANTFPLFQKSLIPACIFGLAVSLAVTLSEWFKKKGNDK